MLRTIRFLMGVTCFATLATAAGGPRADLAPAVPLERPGHDAIVALVREHRPNADEEWQQALATLIYEEAVNAEIDPLLVASIVAKESSFLPKAISPRGALGLMQLVPHVAKDVSARNEEDWTGAGSLATPEVNVRLGVYYYKELLARFDGDPGKALTAYNAGPSRVSRQLRGGTYRPSRYALEILDLRTRLRELS